jgi:hypothetical protein
MIIEKVVAPENLSNKEPVGTQWIADIESGKQLWIQISDDINKPNWQRVGHLYEIYLMENMNSKPSWLERFLSLNENQIRSLVESDAATEKRDNQ